jgi:hypothetical protein
MLEKTDQKKRNVNNEALASDIWAGVISTYNGLSCL